MPTGNYFSMLGGRTCFGRPLRDADNQAGEGLAVANYGVWRNWFGADPGILRKRIRLGDKRVVIALFLGVVAVLLTMSGIFGMLSYVIAQRRKELGIQELVNKSAVK